jgi:hypothetical protein
VFVEDVKHGDLQDAAELPWEFHAKGVVKTLADNS